MGPDIHGHGIFWMDKSSIHMLARPFRGRLVGEDYLACLHSLDLIPEAFD